MASNQEAGAQHMMFQQQAYNGYPASAANTMGTWGQNPQAVPYAVAYQQQPDVNSYADKAGYGGAYPPLQQQQYTGGGDNEYMRSTSFTQAVNYAGQMAQQPQNAQWAAAYQQMYPNQQQASYTSYATMDRDNSRSATFNPGAPPPNMNRPPPNVKRENANLQSLNQESAAYTASWVSSTSSIPPELKDEPEREDQSNVFNSNNYADQFSNMSLHDNSKTQSQEHRGENADWKDSKNSSGLQAQQWPGLGQQQLEDNSRRKQERDRRPRDEGRELTWDERLRKAQVQKERVEQRDQRGPMDRDNREHREGGGERGRGSGRGRGMGRGDQQRMDGRDNRTMRDQGQQNSEGHHQPNGSGDGHMQQQQHRSSYRGGRGANGARGMAHGMNAAPNMHMYPGQPSLMMPPRGGGMFMRGGVPPHMPPPPHLMNMQQDERFKNTWLDANAFPPPFGMPFPPVVPFGGMDGGRFRGRGGGRGSSYRPMQSRGGYVRRGDEKKREKTEGRDALEDKKEGQEEGQEQREQQQAESPEVSEANTTSTASPVEETNEQTEA